VPRLGALVDEGYSIEPSEGELQVRCSCCECLEWLSVLLKLMTGRRR
jgi:hypothetical protein